MVHSDMLCFVQAFTSKKKDKHDVPASNVIEESSSKSAKKNFTRKLSFSLKKKSPSSGATSIQDDKTESSPEYLSESYQEKMNYNPELSFQQHAAAAAAAEEILTSTPGSSKARQKKFHRHFTEVPPEEKVINYYSCVLVGDVPVHGNLYITKKYFAFYSSIFGNENKLLIPTASILGISKEKTALIKPNGVAVISVREKHVFGLFLSRDTAYKLMIQVWNAAMNPLPSQYLSLPSKALKEDTQNSTSRENQIIIDDDSSLSGSDINMNGSPDLLQTSAPNKYNKLPENIDISTMSTSKSLRVDGCCQTRVPAWTQYFNYPTKANIIIGTSTIILALLFLSAGILLYRISCLQQSYTEEFTATRSMMQIQEFLSSNLHHISKVRKSLEALSVLIDQENSSKLTRSSHNFDTGTPLANS
ncbi:uncharacterized protein LOC142318754 [Lycorma delicatula]|uniref:uncharacterized protein LOC142318754 n=1 Tax=Lycorma delicatula TaxID=130591 RepID=UPI003F51306F